MSFAGLALIACLAVRVSLSSASGQDFGIGNYVVVSSTPLGGSGFEYVLKVNLTNHAANAQGVTAQVFSASNNTVIVQGVVGFGDLALGGGATCTNNFSLDQYGLPAFDPSPLQWFVSVQAMPLTVAIDSPISGLMTNGTNVLISGTVGPAVSGVQVGRTNAALLGTNFSVVLALEEGRNIITALATNSYGGAGSANVTINRDTTPPFLSIDTPTNGTVVAQRQITVTGQINDAVPGTVNPEQATVTVNGVSAALMNRNYSATDVLLTPGTNQVSVIGVDRAGNATVKQIQVVYLEPAHQKRLNLLSGDGQPGMVGVTLPQPLLVELADENGVAQTNQPVIFSVTKSDGTLFAAPNSGRTLTVQTDDKGQASVLFRLGTSTGSGNNQVDVSSPGVQARLLFAAHAFGSVPARISALIPETQVGEVGKPLAQPWTALVTDSGGNAVPGAGISFAVQQGGGSLNGAATVITNTDSDGRASVLLTLGPAEGINNNVVSATVPGVTNTSASFTASGQLAAPVRNTRVVGLVLDNANQPMTNVLCIIERTFLAAATDPQGRFVISNAPVGAIRLLVDARDRGYPGEWHALEFDLVTVAGRDNSVDRPIYMLPLDSNSAVVAGGDQDVQLQLKGIPGATMTVLAHSVHDASGNPLTNRVTWSQVNQERVPMPPPKGSQFTLAWTVQPPGLRFNPPARVCIPNQGGAPGQMLEMFGFDHDLGAFVSLGAGTVSADASLVCSDPGFGVTKSGWGGFRPVPAPCSPVCHPPADTDCVAFQALPFNNPCDCPIYFPVPKVAVTQVTAKVNGQDQVVVKTNETVNFAVTVQQRDCSGISYHWDFGDGQQDTQQNPTHQYATNGTYRARVTVNCANCALATGVSTGTVVVSSINLIVHKPAVIDSAEPEIPYDQKLTKGAQTFVNLDNDDQDGDYDINNNLNMTVPDNELLKLTLQILDTNPPPNMAVQLEATEGGDTIKVWTTATKGAPVTLPYILFVPGQFTNTNNRLEATFYVEGIQAHTTQRATKLKMTYHPIGPDTSQDQTDTAALTVIGLNGLSWEGEFNSVYNDSWQNDDINFPLDHDPNWPTSQMADVPLAFRVFPDSRVASYLGNVGPPRDQVVVHARLSVEPVEPVVFSFRSFDVDDPSDNQAPVDDDSPTGNADDNRGTSPAKAGKIVGSDPLGILGVTFEHIEASFAFQVTMAPGDNFRIVGSCDRHFLLGLVNNDTAYANNADKQRIVDLHVAANPGAMPEVPQAAQYVTPTLTVWRFLHVEVDAMGPPTTNSASGIITNQGGLANGHYTYVEVNDSLRDGSADLGSIPAGYGRFENGTLRVADTFTIANLDGNGAYFLGRAAGMNLIQAPLPFEATGYSVGLSVTMRGTVTGLTEVNGVQRILDLHFDQGAFNLIKPGTSEIRIGGGPWMGIETAGGQSVLVDTLKIPFVLTDDDGTNAPLLPDTANLQAAYQRAYVYPLLDGGITQNNLVWIGNIAGDSAAEVSEGWQFDAIDHEADPNFWTVYLRSAWQHSTTEDNDPNGESTTFGIVDDINGRGANIYKEPLRQAELLTFYSPGFQAELYVVPHEIGHLFGCLHAEGGLMSARLSTTNLTFSPASLNTIRSASHP